MARQVFVFIGGSDRQNGDFTSIHKAARSGATRKWSSTRSAKPGDLVYLYVSSPSSAIIAQAEVLKAAVKGGKGDWPYVARIGNVKLLESPIGIQELKRLFPGWAWLRMPRSKGIVPQEYAKRLARRAAEASKNSGRVGASSRKAPFTHSQYVRAFKAIDSRLLEAHRRMLRAHAAAPDLRLDVIDLANAAGQASPNYTYSQYGRIGRLVSRALGRRKLDHVRTRVLGNDTRASGTRLVEWTLHPEVAQAVEQVFVNEGSREPNVHDDLALHRHKLSRFNKTTRSMMVDARLGQGAYRDALVAYWQGCAVTGCRVLEVLKASHIKPWRNSNKSERLDPGNGLLLTANLDTLFDKGLISFGDRGMIAISELLSRADRRDLGISKRMRLAKVTPAHRRNLRWHRRNVFRAE